MKKLCLFGLLLIFVAAITLTNANENVTFGSDVEYIADQLPGVDVIDNDVELNIENHSVDWIYENSTYQINDNYFYCTMSETEKDILTTDRIYIHISVSTYRQISEVIFIGDISTIYRNI